MAFLFDVDGTLIDSSGAGGGALLAALEAEFRIEQASGVELHGRTDHGIVRELLSAHGLAPSDENVDKLCTAYFARLPEVLVDRGGMVLDGVHALLSAIQPRTDCSLGLLTGNLPTSARMKLEHYGLWDYFSFGIYGDEAAVRPELAEPTRRAVQRHLQSPSPPAAEQMIIIGDTPLDIQLAQALGCRCLAVATGGFTCEQLDHAGATWVQEDLSDTDKILQWCFAHLGERA